MSCASGRCGCIASRPRGGSSDGWASSSTSALRPCAIGSARNVADRGERDDLPSTDMVEENRRLARENAELRRVNDVLRAASAYFASEIGPTRGWS
jgi:hypothetical protein